MTQIARRVGWKSRRRLHVIDAKAPIGDARDQDDIDSDGDSSWYSCDARDCCGALDWATWVMPPMTFMRDGLVHVSRPHNPTAVCGEEGNWPVPSVGSTDEAIAYARQHAGDFRAITCLVCIASALFFQVRWAG